MRIADQRISEHSAPFKGGVSKAGSQKQEFQIAGCLRIRPLIAPEYLSINFPCDRLIFSRKNIPLFISQNIFWPHYRTKNCNMLKSLNRKKMAVNNSLISSDFTKYPNFFVL